MSNIYIGAHINREKTIVKTMETITKNGGNWAKLKDENGAIAVAFGVARVPETWVIDPNGLVRLRVTGELSEGLLEAQLDKLREEFTS